MRLDYEDPSEKLIEAAALIKDFPGIRATRCNSCDYRWQGNNLNSLNYCATLSLNYTNEEVLLPNDSQ